MNYNTKLEGREADGSWRVASNPPPRIEDILRTLFGAKGGVAVLHDDQRGTGGPAPVRSALGAAAEMAALGVRVDAGRVDHGAALSAHDEWVLGRVADLSPTVSALVVRYAQAASRPELVEEAPRFLPVEVESGKPLVIYRDQAAKRGALWCPVEQDPLPEHRDFCRERWRLWWDALDLLAVQCQCAGLDCPREPWAKKAVDFGGRI